LLSAGLALAGLSPAYAQSFEEALAATYANNPTLRAARAGLRAVDEGVSQALSNWRPELSVDGVVGAQYTDTQSDFFSDKGGSQPRVGELNVTQPLYRGGRTVSATNAAEFEVLAERARLKSAEQEVLLDAAVAYVDVWRDQSILELNIKNEQVLQRQLEASRDRFEVGEITRTDVAQSESRLARATADRIAATGRLSSSRAVFQRIVGDYPAQLVQPQAAAGLPTQLDDLIAISLDNDPNVVASEFAESAAKADIRTIKGELLPRAQLRGRLLYEDDLGTSNTERQQAEILAELTIPLYQQGAVSSRTREARQTATQRRIEVDEARAQAREDSIEAWEALVTARGRGPAGKRGRGANRPGRARCRARVARRPGESRDGQARRACRQLRHPPRRRAVHGRRLGARCRSIRSCRELPPREGQMVRCGYRRLTICREARLGAFRSGLIAILFGSTSAGFQPCDEEVPGIVFITDLDTER
jgi:outer membrane protein/adhesin transport system outer membrane protein